MIDISEALQEAIEAPIKQVTPIVIARLADNRFLNNVKTHSTSEAYENMILSRSPKLYWRFNEFKGESTTPDLSRNSTDGTLNNITSTTDSPILRKNVYIDSFFDNFTRANSTYEPGFLSGNENTSWETNNKGLWGISSNKLYISEWDNSIWEKPFATCVVDSGGFNGYIQYKFATTPANASQHGVCLRYIDEDNFIGWKFVYSIGFHVPLFYKVVNGVYTGASFVNKTMAINDVIKFEFIDDTIVAYKNGTQFDSYTITDDIFLDENVTKCGLAMHDSTSASIANTRWGDVTISTYNTLDRSFSFNGTSSYVYSSDVGDINITEDFSLCFWFKNNDVVDTQYLLRYFNGASDKFGAYLDGSELNVYVEDNASQRYELSYSPMLEDEWHFVAFTKTDGFIYLYIDGELVADSPMNEYIKDLTNTLSTFIVGAETDFSNYYAGLIDEVSIHSEALSAKNISMLYGAANNEGTFTGSTKFFLGEQASNGVDEETFAFAVTDSLNEYGSVISACGEYRTLPTNYSVTKEFGWWSRTKSDSNGNFSQDEIMWTEFDKRYANKISITTAYINSRVKSVDYYLITYDDELISDTVYFEYGQMILNIDIDELEYKAFGLKMNSTWFGNSHGIIHEFALLWDVDISDYVISFSFDKVRDNYDSTLPIGLTGANSGSITLDNTERLFNPYGDSIYSPYILPDVELFISLRYKIGQYSYEDIKIAGSVFIDNWNVNSSSMTLEGSFRDFSKYIQEETMPEGFLYLNSSAGRALENIMKSIQFPARKINTWDTYYNMIWKDRPWAMWRMSDISTTIEDHGGRYDGTITGSGYTQGKSSLLPQEYEAITQSVFRESSDGSVITNQIEDQNKKIVYSTQFDGTANTRVEVSNSELSFSNNWSIEAICKLDSVPTNIGDRFVIVSKQNSSNYYNYLLYIEKKSSDGYSVGCQVTTPYGVDITAESNEFTYSEIVGTNLHIVGVKDGNWLYVSVDNTVDNVSDFGGGACHTNGDDMTIGGLEYSVSGSRQEFIGYIGPVTIWNRALTIEEIEKHYTASLLSEIYIFPYLFSKDSTPWDAMLEIATADIGMFYFDEDGEFVYEYLYTLHESVFDRHQNVQYELTDEENIVGGSHPIDIQVNKVTVNINPAQTITNNHQSIWRAEQGESLAVTTLAAAMDASQTTISVTDTDTPIWLKSGYFKVDDEIILYGNRENNQLLDLQRGMFNTKQTSHSNGALCREARVYDIEYTGGPATGIKFPFLTAREFDGTADVDSFTTGPYTARVIVSANDTNTDGDLVILEGKNPVTELENFFSIAGIVFETKSSDKKITKEVREISSNIRRFRVKELTIDNQYIQEESYAEKIADYLIRFFGVPVQIVELEVTGLPQLQLSDMVEIVKFEQLNIVNKRFWIISSGINYDGGISHTLSLREYTEGL